MILENKDLEGKQLFLNKSARKPWKATDCASLQHSTQTNPKQKKNPQNKQKHTQNKNNKKLNQPNKKVQKTRTTPPKKIPNNKENKALKNQQSINKEKSPKPHQKKKPPLFLEKHQKTFPK